MSGLTTSAVSGEPAVRRADGGAARLYVEYRERIYRFCYGRLRSREEAEDAVQNVFMRVHMALDKGVVPEYEAAWLFKIAHNVCLSRIDSNARRGAEELHAFDDDDVQVAAPEVSRDELAGLSAALEDMPHNLRTAILLREWQGLSYAEVADAMGLSVSAVETLIFRARRHLAWALEHPGEKRKSPVGRLLDLLGLGWLRNVLLGAGPVAKLAAGAALLALGGGTAAVALTTDAHSRPSTVPHVRGALPAVPAAQVVTVSSSASPRTRSVARTGRVGHRTPKPGAPAAAVVVGVTTAPAAAASGSPATAARTSTARASAPPPKPAPVATTVKRVTTTAPQTSSVPTVTVPTVTAPSAPQTPTVTLPAVSVPTVTVPTVSVPTVTLPVGGGGLLGK